MDQIGRASDGIGFRRPAGPWWEMVRPGVIVKDGCAYRRPVEHG